MKYNFKKFYTGIIFFFAEKNIKMNCFKIVCRKKFIFFINKKPYNIISHKKINFYFMKPKEIV